MQLVALQPKLTFKTSYTIGSGLKTINVFGFQFGIKFAKLFCLTFWGRGANGAVGIKNLNSVIRNSEDSIGTGLCR
jgi:hypothetical protein